MKKGAMANLSATLYRIAKASTICSCGSLEGLSVCIASFHDSSILDWMNLCHCILKGEVGAAMVMWRAKQRSDKEVSRHAAEPL